MAEHLTCRLKLVKKFTLLLILNSILLCCVSENTDLEPNVRLTEFDNLKPTVFVAVLVRNKAHSLPWFFGHFERLNYPKSRILVWIRSDHNIDNSSAILQEWTAANQGEYHAIDLEIQEEEKEYSDERSSCDWSPERFNNVIRLREEALQAARDQWADYLFMLDADVVLENPDTLELLMEQNRVVIGPMLNASIGETYSNFWGAMDEEGYYERVPEYFDIVNRKITGCFHVPMVHTVLLIDLRKVLSTGLSYIAPEGYSKAEDDIIIFAHSAMEAGIFMHILNTEYFGKVLVPHEWYHNLDIEREHFQYMKLEALVYDAGYVQSPHISVPPGEKDKLGFDKIYMINLERRPERREKMFAVLDELGIEFDHFPAVDGKKLNDTYLDELGIEMLPGFSDPWFRRKINESYLHELCIDMLPGFADPYHGRPLTMGEIGCFLSHYFIWQDILKNNYEKVIVFEDDVRFEPYFRRKLENLMKEVTKAAPDWDLIYLGRKRMNIKEERYLKGTKSLVWPSYTYWTLGYLLSHKGAEKLVDQKPLQKMLPVDEYLPVMFDKHPQTRWKEPFSPRNLVTLSAEPLLLYPTHYLGEKDYISDTEDSVTITPEDGNIGPEHEQKNLKEGIKEEL